MYGMKKRPTAKKANSKTAAMRKKTAKKYSKKANGS